MFQCLVDLPGAKMKLFVSIRDLLTNVIFSSDLEIVLDLVISTYLGVL